MNPYPETYAISTCSKNPSYHKQMQLGFIMASLVVSVLGVLSSTAFGAWHSYDNFDDDVPDFRKWDYAWTFGGKVPAEFGGKMVLATDPSQFSYKPLPFEDQLALGEIPPYHSFVSFTDPRIRGVRLDLTLPAGSPAESGIVLGMFEKLGEFEITGSSIEIAHWPDDEGTVLDFEQELINNGDVFEINAYSEPATLGNTYSVAIQRDANSIRVFRGGNQIMEVPSEGELLGFYIAGFNDFGDSMTAFVDHVEVFYDGAPPVAPPATIDRMQFNIFDGYGHQYFESGLDYFGYNNKIIEVRPYTYAGGIIRDRDEETRLIFQTPTTGTWRYYDNVNETDGGDLDEAGTFVVVDKTVQIDPDWQFEDPFTSEGFNPEVWASEFLDDEARVHFGNGKLSFLPPVDPRWPNYAGGEIACLKLLPLDQDWEIRADLFRNLQRLRQYGDHQLYLEFENYRQDHEVGFNFVLDAQSIGVELYNDNETPVRHSHPLDSGNAKLRVTHKTSSRLVRFEYSLDSSAENAVWKPLLQYSILDGTIQIWDLYGNPAELPFVPPTPWGEQADRDSYLLLALEFELISYGSGEVIEPGDIGFDLVAATVPDPEPQVAHTPLSLGGKVMVGIRDGSAVPEFHHFTNESSLTFLDDQERSTHAYSWDASTRLLTDLEFDEQFELNFETPYSGQYRFRESGSPTWENGTFVLYNATWDLSGNGLPDGADISTATGPIMSVLPNMTPVVQAHAAGESRGVAAVQSAPGDYDLYSATDYQANRIAGQAEGRAAVVANPGAYGLYTESSILDLNLGGLMLKKSAQSDQFELELALETNDQLTPDGWQVAERINHPISLDGDRHFLRVRAGAPQVVPDVKILNHPSLGNILTDAAGRVLYVLAIDSPGGQPLYSGAAWPYVNASQTPKADANITATLGSSTYGKPGGPYLTINGYPVYYSANDTEPGEADSHGLGSLWWTIRPDGSF